MSETEARHLIVSSRVQGVSYRAFVADLAHELGLKGLVRNRRTGSVEAVLIGPRAKIDAAVAVCREGPPAARVDRIDESDASLEQRSFHNGDGFKVMPTV